MLQLAKSKNIAKESLAITVLAFSKWNAIALGIKLSFWPAAKNGYAKHVS